MSPQATAQGTGQRASPPGHTTAPVEGGQAGCGGTLAHAADKARCERSSV